MAHDAEISVTSSPTGPMAYSPAAQRMRHHRERRRLGLRCVTVQVFEKELDTLIHRGLLEANARNDPYAVREALHKHLSRTLGPTP
jgi:DNA-binding GntR family transcriptional regulator